MARVRVRGVAATAVTRFLLDRGHVVVQASPVIRERFGIPLVAEPADVTVKDAGRGELLVVGFWDEGLGVYGELVEGLGFVFSWRAPLGLYSIVKGRVVGRSGGGCVVELPGGLRGVLRDCGVGVGDDVVVSVVHPPVKPFERPVLSSVLRVVGDYVILLYGSQRLSVSEHVRDPVKRRELLAAAAASVMGRGFGVHVRSSGLYASPGDISGEVERLIGVLRGVLEEAASASSPSVLYRGEFLGIIGLSRLAKERLDSLRGRVVSTVPGHHMYKYGGGCLGDLVDFSEALVDAGYGASGVSGVLRGYVLSLLSSRPVVNVTHVRPSGEVLSLGPGRPVVVGEDVVVLRRVIRGGGVYDGLGVERRPGDVDYMFVYPGDWLVVHNYFRGGEWLGSYINVNTPPEVLPGEILYHDLAIDVAVTGDGAEIIDSDELEKYCGEQIITEPLCRKARETAEKAAQQPEKYITKTPPTEKH